MTRAFFPSVGGGVGLEGCRTTHMRAQPCEITQQTGPFEQHRCGKSDIGDRWRLALRLL
jgi:hypothetical protein